MQKATVVSEKYIRESAAANGENSAAAKAVDAGSDVRYVATKTV